MFVERFVAWAGSAGVEERAEAIGDVSATYLDEASTERDRAVCERIFTLFLDDPSSRVRAEMARVLATCENVPRALIWNLTNDIPEVSAVLYRHSTSISDEALIEAVESGSSALQCAIAQRERQTSSVARCLVKKAHPDAVLQLLQNPDVIIGPHLKHEIATRLGADADVRSHLLEDDDLAPTTRQMLVLQLASALTDMVGSKGWLDAGRLKRVAGNARNRAIVDIAVHASPTEMNDYVTHLRQTNQLTTALLLRSICTGNALLFEVAISQLSGSSLKRVQSIVDEGRLSAFKSLYKRTGLGLSAYPGFSAAITVWKKLATDHSSGAVNETVLCERAVNEILNRMEDQGGVDPQLLSLLRNLVAETARNCAKVGASQQMLAAA